MEGGGMIGISLVFGILEIVVNFIQITCAVCVGLIETSVILS